MKLGKIEITPEEWQKWPKIFPFKRLLLSLFLVSVILFFTPRFVFPNGFVDLFGDTVFAWTLIVGLFSGALFVVSLINDVVKLVVRKKQYSGKNACRRIKMISPYSQGMVRAMFETDTRSRKLNLFTPTWAELRRGHLVLCAEFSKRNSNEIECYLASWVNQCLLSNPDFLNSLPVIADDELPF